MNFRQLCLLVCAAALSVAAGNPAPRNWNTTVAATPTGSHVLGNPAAQVKLVEYISYTCPHCAHFEQQSEGALRVGYVASGKVSIEVRNFVRDPIDLAAALLAHCGPPSGFFMRHTAILRGQDRWIDRLANASDAQKQRWSTGPVPQRMRAIATDFGFYALIASRGVDRRAADRCLANEALAKQLAEQNNVAVRQGVRGTPSFMLDGVLLAGTHDWASLEPQLRARF